MSLANTPQTPRTTAQGAAGGPPPGPAPVGGSWTTVEPPHGAAPSVYDTPASFQYARSTYRPTAAQLARDEARRAFWRRNVLTPILIAAVIFGGLFVLLFVLAFAAPRLGLDTAAVRSLIAGLAGLVVILMAIPLTALMSLLPLAYAAWWLNRRQKRRALPETGPMAYRSRVQTLLWQLESLLDRAAGGVNRGSARVRRPLIGLYARADYWREFGRGLRRYFVRGADSDG